MLKTMACMIGCGALIACASNPPTEHLAASMAAVRGAETAGAASVPQAALHLKLAQEQIAQAREMIARDQNDRADAMTIRAFNDAELALALAREAQIKSQLESFAEANPGQGSAPTRGADEPLDATNPPGVGAPNTPARPAGN